MYIHFAVKDIILDTISSTEFELKNGLNIKINKSNLTAGIILSMKTDEEIFIPRFFEYQSKKYLITYIGSKAFYLNKSIKSITFSEDSELHRIDDSAFSESTIEKLSIPASLTELGKKWCSHSEKLFKIEVDPKNQMFNLNKEKFMIAKSKVNGIFDIITFVCRDISGIVEISSEIQKIAPCAFDYCKKMNMISFKKHSTLKVIDDWAFYACTGLEKIMPIPSSVVKIGYQSFMFASRLESIEFFSEELHIYDSCFSSCSSLILVSLPNARNITIDINAFYGSKKGSILTIKTGAELHGLSWKLLKKRQL